MRLFVAIEFDEKTKSKMIDVQDQLRAAVLHGNFSRPENLHLTLAFLGEVPEERVGGIIRAMDRISSRAFDAQFSRIGQFRSERDSLWWIGMRENPCLTAMRAALTEYLTEAGYQYDKKRFRPHITIARQVVLASRPEIKIKPFGTRVSSISLMLSERIDGELKYTELYRKKLEG